MRLMLKSVLAALFHMLSFSMAESKFAANPEYAATHSLLTELQSGHKLRLILGTFISRQLPLVVLWLKKTNLHFMGTQLISAEKPLRRVDIR